MKKIAYLTTQFPVLSETFIGNEIRAMQKAGHEITLCSFEHLDGPAQPDDQLLAKQLKRLIDVPAAKALWQLSSRPGRLHSAMAFINQQTGLPRRSLLWYGARLSYLVEQQGCQHIHAHFGLAGTATAIVAARLAGVTVSFTCHGYDIYRSPSDLTLKLNSADLAVAVCDEMQTDMLQLAPEAHVTRVRCGIDPEQFQSDTLNTYQQKRLLYIGRLSETKGVDILLHALANIPARDRPKLDIVGDGPLYLALLKKMIGLDLIGYVHFLGAKDQRWFVHHHQYYTALVAPFVVTESGVKDTGPLVIKEAMALRLPIITTDIKACQEMMARQPFGAQSCGEMVKSGDVAALANCIKRFMRTSPAILSQMGLAGRQHLLKHFAIAGQAKRLSDAIEHCHEKPGHKASNHKETRHAELQP